MIRQIDEHAVIELQPAVSFGLHRRPQTRIPQVAHGIGVNDARFLDLVGFIPRENLVGRAEILFFSINGSAWKIWEWLETIRFERLLESIE